jgi:hypothetical protein
MISGYSPAIMKIQSIIDLLEKIHRSGKLCQGGEQSPNSEELWEAIQELKKAALDNPGSEHIAALLPVLKSKILEQAIDEMDKSVRCLAIELPELVWNDVNGRWQAIKNALVQKVQA